MICPRVRPSRRPAPCECTRKKNVFGLFTSDHAEHRVYEARSCTLHKSGDDKPGALQPKMANSLPWYSNSLKRKMVFRMNEELRSPLVRVLEEITDTDRITGLCVSALKSISKSRTCRKFLYHMSTNSTARYIPGTSSSLNISNNGEHHKKRQMLERVIGKSLSKHTSMTTDSVTSLDASVSRVGSLQEPRDKLSQKDMFLRSGKTYKIEGLQESKEFDYEDEEYSAGQSKLPNFQKSKGGISKSTSVPQRRDSARPVDVKLPIHSTLSSRLASISPDAAVGRFSPQEILESDDPDADLAIVANLHLTKREQALKLLAEIQMKIDKRYRSDEDENSSQRPVAKITPQEALQCAWLRLSKTQIATLEELIRQQGKDPGIHAHTDITNYDVFAEIREIRKREQAFKEEDEYKKQ